MTRMVPYLTVHDAASAIAFSAAAFGATYAAAVAAGATADRVPADQGDERRGWLVDPFGHRWAIHSPLG